MPPKRNYGQFCSLARALDLVGERWTLLIVRDLLAGPRRYKDLMDGLPGIGANLLAARLKHLEETGLVKRSNPQFANKAYMLTDTGRKLEPALVALADWGQFLLEHPQGKDLWLAQWNHLALKARFKAEKAAGLDEIYAFQIGDYAYYLWVTNGKLVTGEGRPPKFQCLITMEPEPFIKVFVDGSLKLEEAMNSGLLELEGSQEAFQRCLGLFTGEGG